jgi:hypothetical protein
VVLFIYTYFVLLAKKAGNGWLAGWLASSWARWTIWEIRNGLDTGLGPRKG